MRYGSDGVGRRKRSFGYNASSRVVEQLQFIEGGYEGVDQRRGSMEARGGTEMGETQLAF